MIKPLAVQIIPLSWREFLWILRRMNFKNNLMTISMQ